jgi:hypothetical protein
VSEWRHNGNIAAKAINEAIKLPIGRYQRSALFFILLEAFLPASSCGLIGICYSKYELFLVNNAIK